MINSLASKVKERLALSGGTMTGALSVPSITIYNSNKTGGTIIYEDSDSMLLTPGKPGAYVMLGSKNCTVDIDGWITTPFVHITDPSNTDGGGTLCMTVDNKVYNFNMTKAIELGILQEP